MINREENPDNINSFLDYSATILNKSPNSIKEYNYDLQMFLRFILKGLIRTPKLTVLLITTFIMATLIPSLKQRIGK